MKGHMEDGKFHPHIEHKKGVRKSRDQSTKTKGIRLRRTDKQRLQIKDAEEIGAQAFRDGKSSIPASDPNAMSLLKGKKVGDVLTIPLLKAWSNGWWNESMATDRADKKTALDFIESHPNATADNLSESTDIGGVNGNFDNADIEIDRILTILELENKITKDFDEKDHLKEFAQYKIKAEGEVVSTSPRIIDDEDDEIHSVGETILDQLKHSRVNGFPFFAYTGIKDFVLIGDDTVQFGKIPKNPNNIEKIVVRLDKAQDLYNVSLFSKNNPRGKRFEGVFFDQLSDIIVDGLGVR